MCVHSIFCFTHSGNPAALIFEYTPFGCLHPYLLIKRRARLSKSRQLWAGLDYLPDESLAIKALDETDRPCLSPLLDDYETRSRPFKIPLGEPFSEVDVLLFGLQIASVLDFLVQQGVSVWCVGTLCGEYHSLPIPSSSFLTNDCPLRTY